MRHNKNAKLWGKLENEMLSFKWVITTTIIIIDSINASQSFQSKMNPLFYSFILSFLGKQNKTFRKCSK